MSAPAPKAQGPSLADRLRDVQVGVRADLDVTRHVFRGNPTYVVRDPVTFQTHALSVADYEIFVRISDQCTLGEVFAILVRENRLSEDRADEFYQFVFQLHQLGFLALPISDARALHQRSLRRQAQQRRRLASSLLFLRVPLFNPDAFLDRTARLARPLFTRGAFALWLVLAAAAAILAALRWSDLVSPLAGVLALQNLPMLWLSLIVLKAVHEFGHAYACKHFGGCVPEMGAFLILFTPCAYVDATDSWRFPRKRDRLIVCLAGMYVESIVAVAALFVWLGSAEAPFLNALAYQTMLLASVTTVAFNLNPLMRFDGYYILSDLLEIPNLRARSAAHVLGILKRTALGVASRTREHGARLRAILLAYGLSSAVYRVLLVFGIAALVAVRLPVVGGLLAVVLVGAFFVKLIHAIARYLLRAEETAAVRGRAVALCVLLLIGLPTAALFLPLPGGLVARGVLTADATHTVYAGADGFVRAVHAEPGDHVAPGAPLYELEDPSRLAALHERTAEAEAALLRLRAAQPADEAEAAQERERVAFADRAVAAQSAELDKLQILAAREGAVVEGLGAADVGRFVRQGDAVAIVSSGSPVLRVLVTEQELDAFAGLAGQAVECRSVADPAVTTRAVIERVAPAGSREIGIESLTHLAGGQIAVDAATGKAGRSFFEVVVRLDEAERPLNEGATYLVRFPAKALPLGDVLGRRLLRFRDSLLASR